MDLVETSRREKSRAFFGAIALALVVAVIAPPVVQAAVTRVRGTVTAKVKDSRGGAVEANPIADQGITDVPGSEGALDVANFAGGAGVLGAAFCHAQGNVATVPGGDVITSILITGTDGQIKVASPALQGHPAYPGALLTARVTDTQSNVFVDMANGLGTTAPVTFTASGTDCQLIILGHGAGQGG